MSESRRNTMRFPLELPALLRWQVGRLVQTVRTNTKNISRSGLYLLMEKNHQPSSKIEFEVELPTTSAGGGSTLLRGKGRLIRREDLGNQKSGIVARIDRCELVTTIPPAVTGDSGKARASVSLSRNPKSAADRPAASR